MENTLHDWNQSINLDLRITIHNLKKKFCKTTVLNNCCLKQKKDYAEKVH